MNHLDGAYTNSTCAMDFSLDDVRRGMAKMRALQQKHLRKSAEMVEQVTCHVCGRKPTVTNNGFGETVVICRHIWEALKEQCQSVESVHPLSPLEGVRFEVFEDGPARW